MKQITSDQIQERFDSLPEDIKIAITSPEVNDALENVAQSNGLRIDQLGELVDLVGLVMLGFVPSRNFVSELCKEAEIGEIQARKIVEDVNREVLGKIKTLVQEVEEKNRQPEPVVAQDTEQVTSPDQNPVPAPKEAKPTHITDLEKAGGFTIEHEGSSLTNTAMMDGVGSDVLRAGPVRDRWAPVQQTIVPKGVSIPTPTQAPKTEPASRPAPAVKPAPVVTSDPIVSTPNPVIPNSIPTISIPTPIATPILEPVAPTQPVSIPEKISITVPEPVAPIAETAKPASIPPTQPVIPEQKIAGVSSTVLNPGSWPTKPKIDVAQKKEGRVFEYAPIKKTPPVPPINLPKEEIKNIDDRNEIKEAIEKAKNSLSKKEEAPVFNLDSYIKKTATVVEPIRETNIPKVAVPPTPIKTETIASTPIPITPPKTPSTPVLPSTPPTPLKPPTPPAPVPPPIPINPAKATMATAPQPPKARGFDPYREPVS